MAGSQGFDPTYETIQHEMQLRAEGALIACVCVFAATAIVWGGLWWLS